MTASHRKIIWWCASSIVVVAAIGGIVWYAATRPPIQESDIIARSGLHWHPEIAIYVKGEKQEIPANIGIGAVHKPMHTHDTSGVIHLEFQGLVLKDDVRLGKFFNTWGKDFSSFGANVKMTINGTENTEYENYLIQDKDKIEIRYE